MDAFPQAVRCLAVNLAVNCTFRPKEFLGNNLACRASVVEAMGLEPTNLLTASQALYQLSYAPSGGGQR
jgi:hypothetical protein